MNLKKAFQIRHSGEGRNPVCEISVEEIKNLLDSGLRRNDESKENEGSTSVFRMKIRWTTPNFHGNIKTQFSVNPKK